MTDATDTINRLSACQHLITGQFNTIDYELNADWTRFVDTLAGYHIGVRQEDSMICITLDRNTEMYLESDADIERFVQTEEMKSNLLVHGVAGKLKSAL